MELQIDLIPKSKKSNFTLVMGAIGVALSVTYIVAILMGNKEKLISQWPFILYMFVYGINGIVIGLGYSLNKIFGSAYVLINDQYIAIKPGVWTKEQSMPWDRIKSMEYRANWFQITQTDGSTAKFSLSDLEFKVLIEARDAIRMMAAEKGITIY